VSWATAAHGVMALPFAVSATIATAEAVRRDPDAELAQRVQAAQQMENAYEYARQLLDDLAAVRRRSRAILN
jgi:hypothetical protein